MTHTLLLRLAAILSLIVPTMTTYAAAPYPERAIRLLVTSAPGSGLDAVARTMQEELGKELGQTIVVENRPGAAGIPGTREALAAKPDGYTLALVSSNHSVNPSLNESLPYDSLLDVTPISMLGSVPLVLAVPTGSPYQTLQDLSTAMSQQEGELNFGSSGVGSALHMATLLLEAKTNTQVMHIPYKGGNSLVTDLVSGEIDAAFLALPTAYGQITAQSLRPLAVSTKHPLNLLPTVPPLSQAGIPDYEFVPWIGVIGPAGMDEAIRTRLEQAFIKVVQSDKLKENFNTQGFITDGSSAQAFAAFLKDDLANSAALIQQQK